MLSGSAACPSPWRMQTDNAAAIDQPARSAPPGHGAPDAASGLLVPAACRPVGRMIHQPTPKAGSNGREHQQHSTDPDEQHREATRAVLVGRTVGASIAASHRVVKEEPGCHQGNAENLDGATHVSSLQLRVARDPHLRTVVGTAPTAGRVGRPAHGYHDGGRVEQEHQREDGIGNHGVGDVGRSGGTGSLPPVASTTPTTRHRQSNTQDPLAHSWTTPRSEKQASGKQH